MEFTIGQVWQVQWVQGSEVLPSHGRSHRTRTAVLTGAEAINGQASTLHFSLPLIEGRRTPLVTASELAALHAKGRATLLGTFDLIPPDLEDEGDDEG